MRITSSVDFTQAIRALRAGATAGAEAAAEVVFDESQRIVPFIKGDLSRSGDFGMLDETRAAITYRDRGAVGAHERTDVAPANNRQRKFLETAMNSQRDEAAAAVAREIRERLA